MISSFGACCQRQSGNGRMPVPHHNRHLVSRLRLLIMPRDISAPHKHGIKAQPSVTLLLHLVRRCRPVYLASLEAISFPAALSGHCIESEKLQLTTKTSQFTRLLTDRYHLREWPTQSKSRSLNTSLYGLTLSRQWTRRVN
jgi:hypothetical protein